MTIAQRITDYWASTETLLVSKPQVGYAAAKQRKIDDAIADVYREFRQPRPYPTSAGVEALGSDALERLIAARATLALVPLARDYLMHERLSRSQSASLGGSMSESLANRAEALDAMLPMLRADIAQLTPLVAEEFAETVISDDPAPSGMPSGLLDPYAVVDPVAEMWRRRGY